MILPPDPSLKDLQLLWEKQYWDKTRVSWSVAANAYECFKTFFGTDRKPRDIFRSDVAEFKVWLKKKEYSASTICRYMEFGTRLYRFLNELEVVEEGFNPFTGMAPRRIRNK